MSLHAVAKSFVVAIGGACCAAGTVYTSPHGAGWEPVAVVAVNPDARVDKLDHGRKPIRDAPRALSHGSLLLRRAASVFNAS